MHNVLIRELLRIKDAALHLNTEDSYAVDRLQEDLDQVLCRIFRFSGIPIRLRAVKDSNLRYEDLLLHAQIKGIIFCCDLCIYSLDKINNRNFKTVEK